MIFMETSSPDQRGRPDATTLPCQSSHLSLRRAPYQACYPITLRLITLIIFSISVRLVRLITTGILFLDYEKYPASCLKGGFEMPIYYCG